LDYLLGRLHDEGIRTKFLSVGSTSGLEAARLAQCDVAGIHLLDAKSGRYNSPFLGDGQILVPGYGRLQGIVFRTDDPRFKGNHGETLIDRVAEDSGCLMVNRNQGSGTRILIDGLLRGRQPAGYPVQSKSHNAVAAAVAQGRADWGVAIETVANQADLGFLPLKEEQFDFVVPQSRLNRPPVQHFCRILRDPETRSWLERMGFRCLPADSGERGASAP
jgi:putative molybdopterin biosynthesis protein